MRFHQLWAEGTVDGVAVSCVLQYGGVLSKGVLQIESAESCYDIIGFDFVKWKLNVQVDDPLIIGALEMLHSVFMSAELETLH